MYVLFFLALVLLFYCFNRLLIYIVCMHYCICLLYMVACYVALVNVCAYCGCPGIPSCPEKRQTRLPTPKEEHSAGGEHGVSGTVSILKNKIEPS